MPDRLFLGRGGFHPTEIAQAYRDENPTLFGDLSDGELISAIRDEDPDTYHLIDPLLIGAELLEAPRGPLPAPKIPTPPVPTSFLDTAITTGLRTIPAVGGAIAGGLTAGPPGVYAGGAGGAGLGETAAQYYERHYGNREAYSPGAIAFETGLGAFNPALKGESALARVGYQAAYGSGLGAAGVTGRSLIEEGQLPSAPEFAVSTALGGAFGATVHGAFEAVRAAKEAEVGQRLVELYRGRRATGQGPDLPSTLQAKSYLEELAQLNQPPIPVPPMQPGLRDSPYTRPTPPLLPAVGGPGRGPEAIRAYPPGVEPPLELVGSQAPPPGRVVGGRNIGEVPPAPPTLQEIVTRIGQGEATPGAPRLVLEGQRVPRGIAESPPLLTRPTAIPQGRTRQPEIAELGGAPPSPEQPRLPEITTPRPIDRTYTTGPNAGPRREGELHGEPRKVRRQIRVGKSLKFEQAPSELHAEDPATYPIEVRREVARMAEELQALQYERPGSVDVPQGGGNRASGYSQYNRATPGAPVYHDILEAAKGAHAHATRADVLKALRGSLLEGRGSVLSDAAAQVARQRIAQEAAGAQRPLRLSLPKGAGDQLIGWVDESGTRALPLQDLDEFQRAAREAGDSELLGTLRISSEGTINPEVQPFFDAASEEAVRRGLITPEQLSLQMAGPGGEGGARVLDFEGAPPGPPPAVGRWTAKDLEEAMTPGVMRSEDLVAEPPPAGPTPAGRAAKDLAYAGSERRAQIEGPPQGVSERRHTELLRRFGGGTAEARAAEIPVETPRIGEAPPVASRLPAEFDPAVEAGDVPPPKPGLPRVGERSPEETPSLLRRLLEEDGVLILDVPSGDRKGLRKWLTQQEDEHGGAAWYARVEQFMDDGEWEKAWKAAASASVRSYTTAFDRAETPWDERRLLRAVQGTPLQEDLPTQIISGARARAGVGEAPPVKDFPVSKRVTQAGAARGKAVLGPAGILNPGQRQRPLSTVAPALRAATLDREVVRLIMEGIESPEGLATVPGNTDTYLRLFRQVGEQVFKGQNLKLLREAGVDISPEALAQHFNATISDAGRTLNLLAQYARTNADALQEAAGMQDLGAALGRYAGHGRGIVSPAGQVATQEVVDRVAQDTNAYHSAALANDLQKRKEVGVLRGLHDASYAWMLSKWNTAVRNYVTYAGRYGVDSLDHALTIPIARLTGEESTAQLSAALLKERGILGTGRPGTAVTPKRAWSDELQTIYDFTTDSLNTLKPTDARRAIRLLLDAPDSAVHYLGSMAGEDLAEAFSDTPVIRHLVNPKVQRVLTMFNRAQEFSARATVFDATTRALLRAKGLDPSELLTRPTQEIVEVVGGQQAFDDLLFTATAQAMEATFAGRTAKDSIPGWLIRTVNQAWPSKLAIPFPRFNFSSAPRWIYDHSPAALFDWVRFPLDRVGITAPKGTAAGGRLYRGVRSQEIQQVDLPLLTQRIGQAERTQGEALQELLATQREWQVRQRQITRLTKRAQQGLPGVTDQLATAQQLQEDLARRRTALKGTLKTQRTVVVDLLSEQKTLLNRVADATGINAPNYAQSLARMSVGTVGLLGAAWVIRSQEAAQGTRWYEYRVDREEGRDPIILDFRPFAPFAQYLFVADVLNDFYRNTDWSAVRAEVLTPEEGVAASPLDWSRGIWNHYEGKYTGQELGAQFAQAFLSISRAAGTTLTLADLMTQNGWPSLEDASRAIVGTIGQYFSRFTVPLTQVSDVVGQFDPEEAKTRMPPKATMEDWERPLAGPIANVPYARQLIPERISQTTGKPVAAEYPLLRALAGIGTAPRDFVTEEVRRVGVPGQSVFIRETGDVGLDRLIAQSYSQVLQQELPAILQDAQYRSLGTPARQRDFLQQSIFPALKRVALAEARRDAGEGTFGEAMVRGENARRQARRDRMLQDLEQALGPEDLPDQEVPPPPGPPGGPSPGAGMLGAPPPGPPGGF